MKNEGRILRTSISSGTHGFAGSGMTCGGRATCTQPYGRQEDPPWDGGWEQRRDVRAGL